MGSLQVSGCQKSNPIQNPPSSQKSCCVPTSPMPHQRQLRRGENNSEDDEPVPANMSIFDLSMDLIKRQHELGITNICFLAVIMICLSPSNAHMERMVKAMNHIKTTERVKLTQVKLNNIFRVSANSTKGKSFDPQPIVDHYVNL